MPTSINQFAVKSNKEKEVDHQWEKDAYHNLLTFTTKDNDNDPGNWVAVIIVQFILLVCGGIRTAITLT